MTYGNVRDWSISASFSREVNRGLMRHPRGVKSAFRDTSTMSRMEVLGLKGMYPSGIFCRIKGFFSQRLEAFWRKPDLVNSLEDRSHLLPLLIRHPRQA